MSKYSKTHTRQRGFKCLSLKITQKIIDPNFSTACIQHQKKLNQQISIQMRASISERFNESYCSPPNALADYHFVRVGLLPSDGECMAAIWVIIP